MDIELVVFDMAGTTVAEGGAVYRCLRDTCAAYGVPVTDADIRPVKGLDKRDALRTLVTASSRRDELLPQLEGIHHDFVARMLAFYRTDPSVDEVPGTGATFRRLRRHGVKIALDTGFSREIAQTLIDRLGWERDHLIDASVASDEVERGRPHPFMIHALMGRLGVVEAGRVAKIGDAPADLFEGRNAGCGMVVGVTRGSSTREQLASCPHDYLIDTVVELPPLLLC